MSRRCAAFLTIAPILFAAAAFTPAQPALAKPTPAAAIAEPGPNLATAQGTVTSADKVSLAVKPRTASGQFGKELLLKVTGTSRVTQLSFQNRSGTTIVMQTEVEVKDLKPQQSIAIIYTQVPSGPVLLSATVLPATK